VEYITDTSGILVKKIKPNFKVLGKKVGGLMKDVSVAIGNLDQEDIARFEQHSTFNLVVNNQPVMLDLEDVEILSEDIPGWQVASEGRLTVALDTLIDEQLREEGMAREFVNRIQNLRKDKGFEVTDKIDLKVKEAASIKSSILNNKEYICAEILAASLEFVDVLDTEEAVDIEIDEGIHTSISIKKSAASMVS
jgi:isoleucyl-tRNA synthetase